MTEELKEQIHERVYNIKVPTLGFSRRDLFNIAMEYAEPREKRIAELEKENKTVSRKANEAIADKLLITAKYNEILNDLNQQNDKLQNENAELKLKLEALEGQTPWKDIKDKSEVIGKLTKAKEIIKTFLGFAEAFGYSPSMDKFITEAEYYAKEKYSPNTDPFIIAVADDAFKDGAEFGYNKANEWHYVKDGLPELYKDVLVVFSQGDCDVKRLTNHNEWVGRGSWCSLTDVIAWKEIVLPELKESE